MTFNLEVRIGEHQAGACGGYTAERLPVGLAWSQECATREEALAAELRIKGWSRKKKEAMMRGDWAAVSRLAKKDFSVKKSVSLPFMVRYARYAGYSPRTAYSPTCGGLLATSGT